MELAGGVVGVGGGASVGCGLLGEADERGVLPGGDFGTGDVSQGGDLCGRECSGERGVLDAREAGDGLDLGEGGPDDLCDGIESVVTPDVGGMHVIRIGGLEDAPVDIALIVGDEVVPGSGAAGTVPLLYALEVDRGVVGIRPVAVEVPADVEDAVAVVDLGLEGEVDKVEFFHPVIQGSAGETVPIVEIMVTGEGGVLLGILEEEVPGGLPSAGARTNVAEGVVGKCFGVGDAVGDGGGGQGADIPDDGGDAGGTEIHALVVPELVEGLVGVGVVLVGDGFRLPDVPLRIIGVLGEEPAAGGLHGCGRTHQGEDGIEGVRVGVGGAELGAEGKVVDVGAVPVLLAVGAVEPGDERVDVLALGEVLGDAGIFDVCAVGGEEGVVGAEVDVDVVAGVAGLDVGESVAGQGPAYSGGMPVLVEIGVGAVVDRRSGGCGIVVADGLDAYAAGSQGGGGRGVVHVGSEVGEPGTALIVCIGVALVLESGPSSGRVVHGGHDPEQGRRGVGFAQGGVDRLLKVIALGGMGVEGGGGGGGVVEIAPVVDLEGPVLGEDGGGGEVVVEGVGALAGDVDGGEEAELVAGRSRRIGIGEGAGTDGRAVRSADDDVVEFWEVEQRGDPVAGLELGGVGIVEVDDGSVVEGDAVGCGDGHGVAEGGFDRLVAEIDAVPVAPLVVVASEEGIAVGVGSVVVEAGVGEIAVGAPRRAGVVEDDAAPGLCVDAGEFPGGSGIAGELACVSGAEGIACAVAGDDDDLVQVCGRDFDLVFRIAGVGVKDMDVSGVAEHEFPGVPEEVELEDVGFHVDVGTAAFES